MTPKTFLGDVDQRVMTLNFLAKRKMTAQCAHQFQMRIEIAGMSREVCESCGKVSVGYVADHFGPQTAQEAGEETASDESGCDD